MEGRLIVTRRKFRHYDENFTIIYLRTNTHFGQACTLNVCLEVVIRSLAVLVQKIYSWVTKLIPQLLKGCWIMAFPKIQETNSIDRVVHLEVPFPWLTSVILGVSLSASASIARNCLIYRSKSSALLETTSSSLHRWPDRDHHTILQLHLGQHKLINLRKRNEIG
jgi:hypothetical protein